MIAQNGNHVPAVIESGAMKQGTKLPSMSFLIKPASSLCNLRCKYCFYEDWARFLKENNFLVGISIDGYKELHDLYRVNASGEGSFERIRGSLEILKKHEVEFNAMRRSAGKPY